MSESKIGQGSVANLFAPAMLLTFSRLVFGPIAGFAIILSARGRLDHPDLFWLAIAIAAVIGNELSDAFDGMVARARGEVTAMGKILDPICDSLSRQTVFIAFMLCGIIPMWLYLVFMYRDGILNLIRIMNAANGFVLAARSSGKIKAVIQSIAIFAVLGVLLAQGQGRTIPMLFSRHAGFWIMIVPAVITFVSMFDYLIPSMPVLKKMSVPSGK